MGDALLHRVCAVVGVGPGNFKTNRECAANDLAERLFFELENQSNRCSLCLKIGDRVRRDNLSLDEVEHLLERWRLEDPTAVNV